MDVIESSIPGQSLIRAFELNKTVCIRGRAYSIIAVEPGNGIAELVPAHAELTVQSKDWYRKGEEK